MNVRPLISFVKEREKIRQLKATGSPAPWTKNKIFQTYRFCNIRRRDDRVSSWLVNNVLTEANIQYDLRSFLMFSAWCRWINWPPTIMAAIDEGFYPKKRIDFAKLGRFVDSIKGKRWTGAYMIMAPRKGRQKKGLFVAKTVIQGSFGTAVPELVKMFEPGNPQYCETAWHIVQQRNFFGGFMAGQVVADWTYTSLLSNAVDLYTWAPPGPGSRRGLNRLLGKPLTAKPPENWNWYLQNLREQVINGLGGIDAIGAPITLMDVQNQLCELDKYLRVKQGQGRPRAKYRPETAY